MEDPGIKNALRIADLVSGYLQARLTAEEERELLGWLEANRLNREAFDQLLDEGRLESLQAELRSFQTEAALLRVKARLAEEEKGVIKLRKRWWLAAAAVLFGLSLGGYWLLRQEPVNPVVQNQQQDILPGSNRATLTLADGHKIVLTRSLRGQIARQGSTQIGAGAGEAITYTAKGGEARLAYNTLSTARGEQSPYPLVLADGTKVWLNAASSVTFPVAFNGNSREVRVTGEALFEVAHDAGKPFRVVSNGQVVVDIGTAFDLNAYGDEPVTRTTLLEGAVRVSLAGGDKGRDAAVLQPGQQTQANVNAADPKISVIDHVDTRDVVAWKNGQFRFYNEEKLSLIMRQVTRWYDVEVTYADESLKDKPFGVIAARFGTVSELLHKLELTGDVKFRLEGRKILVMNK